MTASQMASPSQPLFPLADSTSAQFRWYRRPLGLALLAVTVMLWTLSNFFASTLFANNTYSKPFLITYINSAFFILPLLPIALVRLWRSSAGASRLQARLLSRMDGVFAHIDNSIGRKSNIDDLTGADLASDQALFTQLDETTSLSGNSELANEQSPLLPSPTVVPFGQSDVPPIERLQQSGRLSMRETFFLACRFAVLWFSANWLSSGCFEHTTVGSGTILACTSGVWTLVIGCFYGVERLTWKNSAGVALSLVGVILVSGELSAFRSDSHAVASQADSPFPDKSPAEIRIGNVMALGSAVVYGIYSVMLKLQVGNEARVHMPLFFSLVGLASVVAFWPGFIVLDLTGIEKFELPVGNPAGGPNVPLIIATNAVISLIADLAWAYAILLLDSPLVVTVGLSGSIPLSLIGQSIVHGVRVGPSYWLGAVSVLAAFVLVD